MDPAKSLEALRDAPFWLLAAISVASAALFVTSLVIDPTVPGVPKISIAFGSAFAAGLFAVLAAFRFMSAWLANKRRRDANRFVRIYRPIYLLFLTRHITTASSTLAPYFRDRLDNAREIFGTRKKLNYRIVRAALRALFDKRISEPSGEIEYGGSFPHARIKEIVERHSIHADEKLLECVRRAQRAQYEDQPDHNQLTNEDLALVDHVMAEHHRLSRSFR